MKRLAVLIAAIPIACASAGAAQDCASMSDAAARLACYDRSARKPATKKQPTVDAFATVKATIAKGLKDPKSAQFAGLVRAMRPNARGEPTDTVCGTVNAKNSYGGYTGAKPFVYFYRDNTFNIAGGPSEIDSVVVSNFCKNR